MVDALRPATWLAAAFAGWALGLLVLAFGGLGGRAVPLPDDPALAPPIPVVRISEDAARLGPASDYLAVGERPLFNADRRPVPVAMANAEAQAPFEGTLTSVLLTGTLRLAIFNEPNRPLGTPVRLGEPVPGTAWRLVALEPRRAVLEGPEGVRTLDLRVFDGQSGQPPTPMAADALPKPEAVPADAASPSPMAGAPVSRSAEDQAQIDAIRARIEARRAELLERQVKNNTATVAEQ